MGDRFLKIRILPWIVLLLASTYYVLGYLHHLATEVTPGDVRYKEEPSLTSWRWWTTPTMDQSFANSESSTTNVDGQKVSFPRDYNFGWLLGNKPGVLLRFRKQGSELEKLQVWGDGDPVPTLDAIDFSHEKIGWAIGQVADSKSRIAYVIKNDGRDKSHFDLNQVESSDKTRLVFVSGGENGERLYYLNDDNKMCFQETNGSRGCDEISGIETYIPVTKLAAAPDGKSLYLIGQNNQAARIPLDVNGHGKAAEPVTEPMGARKLLSMAFSQNNYFIVGEGKIALKGEIGGKKEVKAVQIEAVNRVPNGLAGTDPDFNALAVSKDGKTIALASQQGQVYFSRDGGESFQVYRGVKDVQAISLDSVGNEAWLVNQVGDIFEADYANKPTQEPRKLEMGMGEDILALRFDEQGKIGKLITERGSVYETNNKGETWRLRQKETSDSYLIQADLFDMAPSGVAINLKEDALSLPGLKTLMGDDYKFSAVMMNKTQDGKHHIFATAQRKRDSIWGIVRLTQRSLQDDWQPLGFSSPRVPSCLQSGNASTQSNSRTQSSPRLNTIFGSIDNRVLVAAGDDGQVLISMDGAGNSWCSFALIKGDKEGDSSGTITTLGGEVQGDVIWLVGKTGNGGGEKHIGWVRKIVMNKPQWEQKVIKFFSAETFIPKRIRFLSSERSILIGDGSAIAGGNTQNDGSSSAIWYGTDGGQSWLSSSVPDRGVNAPKIRPIDIHAVDKNHAWIAASDGVLLKTKNGGKDWQIWPNQYHPAPWFYPAILIFGGVLVAIVRKFIQLNEQKIDGTTGAGESDEPIKVSERDKLGFNPIVASMVNLLRNRNTPPPMVMTVSGAWGGGKSSFMSLLHSALKKDGVQCIWFNAWHHQYESLMLAPLLSRVQDKLPPELLKWYLISPSGLFFKLKLVFRRWQDSPWLGTVVLLCLALALHFFCRLGVLWYDKATSQKAISDGIQGMMSLNLELVQFELRHLTETYQLPGLLFELLAGFVGVWLLYFRFWKAFPDKPSVLLSTISRNFDVLGLLSSSDEKQIAFRANFQEDLSEVLHCLAPAGPVIFIDDLDRCSPEKMLETLEAINYLVSSAPLFVVFAADMAMVKTGLEKAYALKYLEDEKERNNAYGSPARSVLPQKQRFSRSDLVKRYLEKLIQLEIVLPKIGKGSFSSQAMSGPPRSKTICAAIMGLPVKDWCKGLAVRIKQFSPRIAIGNLKRWLMSLWGMAPYLCDAMVSWVKRHGKILPVMGLGLLLLFKLELFRYDRLPVPLHDSGHGSQILRTDGNDDIEKKLTIRLAVFESALECLPKKEAKDWAAQGRCQKFSGIFHGDAGSLLEGKEALSRYLKELREDWIQVKKNPKNGLSEDSKKELLDRAARETADLCNRYSKELECGDKDNGKQPAPPQAEYEDNRDNVFRWAFAFLSFIVVWALWRIPAYGVRDSEKFSEAVKRCTSVLETLVASNTNNPSNSKPAQITPRFIKGFQNRCRYFRARLELFRQEKGWEIDFLDDLVPVLVLCWDLWPSRVDKKTFPDVVINLFTKGELPQGKSWQDAGWSNLNATPGDALIEYIRNAYSRSRAMVKDVAEVFIRCATDLGEVSPARRNA